MKRYGIFGGSSQLDRLQIGQRHAGGATAAAVRSGRWLVGMVLTDPAFVLAAEAGHSDQPQHQLPAVAGLVELGEILNARRYVAVLQIAAPAQFIGNVAETSRARN